MNWRTDKPTEKVIVAKLTEDFCHLKDSYAILRLVNEPYQRYSEDGEEIPYTAIEKWASLEEEKIPEGLEEAAEESAHRWFKNPDGSESRELFYQPHIRGFKAGAKWQAEQGESFVSKVLVNGMNESHVDGYYLDEKIPEGTDVIVQIRKAKQE